MLDLLLETWREHLAPWINPLWSSTSFWRLLSLVLLTLIAATILLRSHLLGWFFAERRNQHDRDIFRAADQLLGESQLKAVLDYLGDDHSYHSDDMVPVSRFCQFFSEQQNQFLHRKLRQRSQALARSLSTLRNFIALNFFVFPSDQQGTNVRLCMHPRLNIDRGGDPALRQDYDVYVEELESLIDGATDDYNQYRRTVKNALMI